MSHTMRFCPRHSANYLQNCAREFYSFFFSERIFKNFQNSIQQNSAFDPVNFIKYDKYFFIELLGEWRDAQVFSRMWVAGRKRTEGLSALCTVAQPFTTLDVPGEASLSVKLLPLTPIIFSLSGLYFSAFLFDSPTLKQTDMPLIFLPKIYLR